MILDKENRKEFFIKKQNRKELHGLHKLRFLISPIKFVVATCHSSVRKLEKMEDKEMEWIRTRIMEEGVFIGMSGVWVPQTCG
jgi:hypothetical protein